MGPVKATALTVALIMVAAVCAAELPARASVADSPAGARPVDPPNIVVVMADDMRFDDLERVADLKPDGGFDWVRDHGTRFPKLWSTNNLCCPGRATFLTGQTSYNNGVFTNTPYKELDNTLPEWLQDTGYCTGFTGKYMNAYTASESRPPGWTYWEPLTAKYASEDGFHIMRRDGETTTPGTFITDHLAKVSRAQLADCLERDTPAFVALFPYAPHFGSDPKPAYADLAVPWTTSDPSFDEADVSDKPAWLQTAYPVTRAESRVAFGDLRFDPGVVAANTTQTNVRTLLSVDDALRGLIDDLAREGQIDNTLVVLTSDNGYLFFEHRLSGKIVAYEAAQPGLWIAGPGIPVGATSDAFATNLDLAPTIARAASADTPSRRARWDGRTLQKVLVEPGLGHDRFLPIFVADFAEDQDPRPEARGVRTWRYKYILYADGSEELYDLRQDPFEESSVAGDPSYTAIKQDIAKLLDRATSCKGRTCRKSVPEQLQR